MKAIRSGAVSSVVKVIVSILLLLIVVGLIGFVAYFTNGFTSDFRSFYVEYQGQRILREDSKLSFPLDTELRFDCKYVFASGDEQGTYGYNVAIVPNSEVDFEFTVDDQYMIYSGIDDLTSAFAIVKEQDHFILTLPSDFGMQSVLQLLYPGQEVVVPEDLALDGYYYTLVISSYNDEFVYNITFNCILSVASIEMSEEHVVV